MPGFDYTTFKLGDAPVAGMMPITPEMGKMRPHWATYFTVDDADETASEAVKLGATLCMPLKDIPGVGRFCGITSPQGVTFYVITYAALSGGYDERRSGARDGDIAHQRKLIPVGIVELGEPELRLRRAIDDVRLRENTHAFRVERRVHALDVLDLKIDRGAALCLLARWRHTHQKSYGATHEERHLRWRREQEGKPQRVAIEGGSAIEIFDGNHKLPDRCVRQIHRHPP